MSLPGRVSIGDGLDAGLGDGQATGLGTGLGDGLATRDTLPSPELEHATPPATLPGDDDLSPGTDESARLPITGRGSYEIAGKFAQGGIGRILRAHDPVLGRTVALKELLVAGRRTDERRFVREVLLTARLQHPGIVPVYAAGRWPSGEPFYAMKLVSGRSFDQVIAEAHDLPARLALLPHVLAIAETLAFAHAQGIIHRDLKPGNVLVGEFGETVVIDWGLAKQIDEPDDEPGEAGPEPASAGELTRVGSVVGTPGFMSPEQATGAPVDARSDVYALGVILYQTLSGKLPHDADNAAELLYKAVYDDPVPLLRREPQAPEELAAIADKAMARDPAARYPTAKAMADDLRRFQTGQIVGAHRYTAWELLRRLLRRYRAPLAVAAVALLIVVITASVSYRSVTTQRDLAVIAEREARAAEAEALQARNDAVTARNDAVVRADDLALAQAQLRIDSDPVLVLDLLHRTSPGADWRRIRQIAAAIEQRGIPTVLYGHEASISRAVFSPDSKRLATTSDDCTLRVWNLADRTSRAYFGHSDEVWRAAWSPDQRRVATTSRDATVRVWDLETGAAQVLVGHRSGIRNVSFSGDGRTLYSVDDSRGLFRWDLASGTSEVLDRCIGSAFPWDERQISCIAEDPSEVHVHDLRSGKLERYRSDGPPLGRIGATSPDGRWIAAGGAHDATVLLWDRHSGAARRLSMPTVVPGEPREIRFSADSRRMLVPTAQTVLAVHDLVADTVVELQPHKGYTRRAVFSPDGAQIASVGGDIGVKLSDPDKLDERSLAGAQALMIDVQFSRDGTYLATAGNDPRVFLWTASEQRGDRWRMPGGAEAVRLADAPAADEVLINRGEALVVLDTATLQARLQLKLSGALDDLALAPDASVAIGRRGLELSAWDARSGALLHSYRVPPSDGLCHLGRGLPDPLQVLLICAEGVHTVDLRDGTRVDLVAALAARAAFVATSGELVIGGKAGRLVVRTPRGGPMREIHNYHGPVHTIVAVPGQRQVVVSSDRIAEVWDLEQGRRWPLPGHSLNLSVIAVSGDGRRVATISRDNLVRVFERETGALQQTLAPRVPLGNIASLSPDGERLVISTHDHRLLLWDLAAGPEALLEPRELAGHRAQVFVLRFAADGASVISVDFDGRAIRWADDLPRDREGVRRWVAGRHDPRITRPTSRNGCTPAPDDLSSGTAPAPTPDDLSRATAPAPTPSDLSRETAPAPTPDDLSSGTAPPRADGPAP
ncbi:MAG: protein kinase [Nannocystis sp.]|uniref:WD40 repeat domain-containing serine/threonine protein kinase n=1 Tax=Nannocystis sp. TaxID=1962667 RepID=UPI0024295747|nr:serine/threonine-protein kinase [Nannocystis sp.]MBK9755375.1 protein kinase [Nannocystis sp.]